jgi:hypothetical protein
MKPEKPSAQTLYPIAHLLCAMGRPKELLLLPPRPLSRVASSHREGKNTSAQYLSPYRVRTWFLGRRP